VVACTGGDVVDGVELASGSHLPADVVVEAVGGRPNTEWLDAGSMDVSSGVLTGNDLLVEGHPEVAACGDVVRFPNPLFPGVLRRVEHWTMATETARQAGRSLVRGWARPSAQGELVERIEPFRPLPYFWSEQHGLTVQGLGMIDAAEQTVELERGAAGEAAFGHLRSGRLVGVTLLGLGSRLAVHREQLEVALGLR
jgi:NADPH-dependent 2,4-dienoyl-CoA reductase/sulfur reductase-like enzyme